MQRAKGRQQVGDKASAGSALPSAALGAPSTAVPCSQGRGLPSLGSHVPCRKAGAVKSAVHIKQAPPLPSLASLKCPLIVSDADIANSRKGRIKGKLSRIITVSYKGLKSLLSCHSPAVCRWCRAPCGCKLCPPHLCCLLHTGKSSELLFHDCWCKKSEFVTAHGFICIFLLSLSSCTHCSTKSVLTLPSMVRVGNWSLFQNKWWWRLWCFLCLRWSFAVLHLYYKERKKRKCCLFTLFVFE